MRNERKRHAQPGEELQLYTAMRTKQCQLIGRAICAAVTPIRLDFKRRSVRIAGRPIIHKMANLDAFALRDGFTSWFDLYLFWKKEHGAIVTWSGVLVEWRDFQMGEAIAFGAESSHQESHADHEQIAARA